MNTEDNSLLENKIFDDAIQLLTNGHRMTYVFKYVRGKAVDDEMRGRIMERITSDNHARKISEARLEAATSPRKLPKAEVIICLVVISGNIPDEILIPNGVDINASVVYCLFRLSRLGKSKAVINIQLFA